MIEAKINLFVLSIIALGALIFIYKKIKQNPNVPREVSSDRYNLDYLIEGVKSAFEDILNKNINSLNLNKEETIKREKIKIIIRKSLRTCSQGDKGAKAYVKDYIKDIIQERLDINEDTIDKVIPFDQPNKLNSQDKFDILLYYYKKTYGYDGFKELIINYDLASSEQYYQVSKENIDKVFEIEGIRLDFSEKLEVLSQRIYQLYKGLGAIDEIRDMKIDGVSGGVSGVPFDFYTYDMEWFNNVGNENLNSYNSVWIFFKGKTVNLSFLGFGSQRELIRVCKNIYRHGNPGQLSEARGYVANEMKDGSRVVTFRPPFSASWAFFVRKFDSMEKKDIKYLITDEGNEEVISLIRLLVKGYQDIIITGAQGSGKTTLLMSLIQFLSKRCNLRIYELIFELFAQKLYPEMNILSLRETNTVFGQAALDILKKTDGSVIMIGEIASYESANWLIETSQVASNCVLGSHHAVSTEDLIDYFRNAALRYGGFRDERIAEEQAIRAINFDIHMEMDRNGHRYIERITEIVPAVDKKISKNPEEAMVDYFNRITNRTFVATDIVVFEDNRYILKNKISNLREKEMKKNLTIEESHEFDLIFDGL